MRRTLTGAVVVALAASLSWLFFSPVPIRPVAWKAPPAPKLKGPYAPNDALASVEWLGKGQFHGPEATAVDAAGRVYTGVADGRLADGRNDSTTSAARLRLGRHLMRGNPGVEALATALLYPPSQPIVRAAQVDLDYVYDEDPVRPGFMHVRWGPGEGSPEHRQKSWTANVVLRGRLRIGERWFDAGDVAVIEPNIWYVPLLAGSEGAEILEIHATLPGVEAIWRDPNDPACGPS